jgi:hypothetical protein
MPFSNIAVLDKIIGDDTVVDMNLDQVYTGSIQINVASPSGDAFYCVAGLQCSDDGSTFVDVSGTYQSISVSGYSDDQTNFIHMAEPDYKFARCRITEVSGIGDLTVIPYFKTLD